MDILKIKKILIIMISILLAFSLVFFIYNKITYSISINKIQVDEANIKENLENSKLVKDYSVFYSINSACKNYIQYVLSKDYAKTHTVLAPKYKRKMPITSYSSKMKKYKETHFLAADEGYNIEKCLYKAYKYRDYKNQKNIQNMYICQIETGIKGEYLNLVIKLENSGELKYKIWYVGI